MTDFAPPVLVTGARGAIWRNGDGRCENISFEDALERLGRSSAVMVCHAGAVAGKLGIESFVALDVLELFAFVRPARFCLPTPHGLATFLDLPVPGNHKAEAESIAAAALTLLGQLAATDNSAKAVAGAIAGAMQRGGWPWATVVLKALESGDKTGPPGGFGGLRVWELLKRWDDTASTPPPGSQPVGEDETRQRLTMLLGDEAENRPRQADYAAAAAATFAPREHRKEPHILLADAGTGIGKTLGYIAPASLWSEKNGAAVWISTFTRNLQRQLDGELDRLYPDPAEKRKYVVVRKGRENYLCLLNFADAVGRFHVGAGAGQATALGLLARWILASRDGDMVGGDFPAWLASLLGRALTIELTDTRGECIYSGCPHYDKCFVERSVRRARGARIVVANHALTMIQAARHGGGDGILPSRYVIDEGHHLFDAADSAFSAHLSGLEAVELRRWIIGAEKSGRTRNRGIRARIDDLLVGNEAAAEIIDELIRAAHALPATGWLQRISGGAATGATEEFLMLVRQQVYARDRNVNSPYSLETATDPHVAGLSDAAKGLANALSRLTYPLAALINVLEALIDDGAAEMDSPTRSRIESVIRGLERRNSQQVQVWRAMLDALDNENGKANPDFVDWFSVERIHGRDFDIGLHRHWLDPTRPFAATVLEPAHGVLVTSATLRDCSGDDEADWNRAMARTGAAHIDSKVIRMAAASPFDYAARTRVFVVSDVNRNDPAQVAAAYRELFKASNGGGLGLFTAISRMRAVHELITGPLDEVGIKLMAQHVDPLDIGTLIDIFRADKDSCLLGTDAVRDGIDVPGRSLRLIVFDRMPWPRPDILHKARKAFFGGQYDDMLGRLKLKQAYGRLVRREDDKGVFVMLDRAMPSRLASAFPEGVEIQRLGLAEAVEKTRKFLAG